MKFRNPETGKIYRYIVDVLDSYCNGECEKCKIKEHTQGYKGIANPCTWYCVKKTEEAAHLMGYEVIEEEQEKPTRASILDEAKRCVCGQREQDYGSPENNFRLIASLWEPYIRTRCVSDGADVSIQPEDVAMLMALLKIARICSGTGTADSFVDLAGYAACGGEIAGENNEKSTVL